MLIILGNYGNPTLSLIAWLKKNWGKVLNHFPTLLPEQVFMVSIDTGWAAEKWEDHINACEAWVKTLHFTPVRLLSQPNFVDMVEDRKAFPSKQFQWCVSFLKAVPFLEWLDTQDPDYSAVIVLPKKRFDSPSLFQLTEWQLASEHYAGRKVWHPLWNVSEQEFVEYLQFAGSLAIHHRSLECEPCIHQTAGDFNRMSKHDIAKLECLEHKIQKNFFAKPIATCVEDVKNSKLINTDSLSDFHMGCGSPFACGE